MPSNKMKPLIDSTPNPAAVAVRLKRDYPLKGRVACRLLMKSRACLYDVRAGGKRYLFKLLYSGEMGPWELGAQMEVLEYLRARKVAIQSPQRSKSGEPFIRVKAPEGQRLGALFHWVPGLRGDSGAGWQPRRHKAHGALIGQFHLAAAGLPDSLALTRLDPDYMIREALPKMRPWLRGLPGHAPRFRRVAAWAEKELRALPRNSATWGVVHGDSHGGNVHFLGEKAALIDTEQIAYGWRIYDVATNFWGKANALSKNGKMPGWARAKALAPFISAYQGVHPLSPLERRCIPAMMVAREFWLNRVFCDWVGIGGDLIFNQLEHFRRSIRLMEGIRKHRADFVF